MSHSVAVVPIELDRTRNLRLTFAEAREFKKMTANADRPKGISLVLGDLKRFELDEDDWILLFWIMLKHEDPALELDAVAAMLDIDAFHRAGEAFSELVAGFGARGEESAAVDPTRSTAPVP